jgi:hypothetical protein
MMHRKSLRPLPQVETVERRPIHLAPQDFRKLEATAIWVRDNRAGWAHGFQQIQNVILGAAGLRDKRRAMHYIEHGRAVVLAVAPDVEFDLVVLAAQRIAFDEPSDLSMVPGVLSLQRLFMASQLRGKVLKRAFSLVENEYVIREPHLPAGLACT